MWPCVVPGCTPPDIVTAFTWGFGVAFSAGVLCIGVPGVLALFVRWFRHAVSGSD